MKLKKLIMLTLIFAGLISHVDTLTRGGGGGHGGGGGGFHGGGGGRGGGYHGGGRGYGGRGGYGRGYGGRNWRGYGYGYGGGYWGYPWYGWGWGWPYYGYGWGYPYVGVSYTSSSGDNGYDDNRQRQSNLDDEGRNYWEIRNATSQPIYVSAPGSTRIYIAPKKHAQLYRKNGFNFRVEGSSRTSQFFATSHTVKIMQDENNHYFLGFYGAERPE